MKTCCDLCGWPRAFFNKAQTLIELYPARTVAVKFTVGTSTCPECGQVYLTDDSAAISALEKHLNWKENPNDRK